MTQDEHDILSYFKANPTQWVSMKEIALHVGGKPRFQEDPAWPRPALKKFLGRQLLEEDASGAYRLKPRTVRERRGPRLHVSPAIAEILKKSGKSWNADLGNDKGAGDEYERFLHQGGPGGMD